jgi:UDP-4-amino-4-deoxy-L-arabinose formyltransferase/UDP-glucuronic acid dehydrogenase (UDP-4-keto-hexauronic acid decarboxylating)
LKLLLAGDSEGIRQLLDYTPVSNVVGLCAASVRPQYLGELHDLARKLGVPLLIQPRVRELDYPDFVSAVQSLETDLIIVNSYSMLIQTEILLASRLGGLNLHASLLPRNRGPNPTQWALLRGESRTGVTLHEMTDRLDEGPIIAQKEIPIFPEDTWLTVQSRLKDAGNQLLEETLPELYSGNWVAIPQIEMESSSNPRRSMSDSRFEWTDRLIDIYRLHRAVLPPHPPAWSITKQGNRVEIVDSLTPMELLRLVWPEREGLLVGGMT